MHKLSLSTRNFISLAIVFGLVLLSIDFWAMSRWKQHTLPEFSGSLGATLGPLTGQYRSPITALQSDSPFLAAGVQVGDGVVFDHRSDIYRYLAKGELIGLTLYRGEVARHLEIAASAENPERDTLEFFFLDWASLIVSVLSGMLIAIRRPAPGPQRILCALLIVNGIGSELRILPNGFVYDALMVYGWDLLGLAFYQLYLYFALVFPENAPLIRHRWVRRVLVAQFLLSVAFTLWGTLRVMQWMPAAMVDWISFTWWEILTKIIPAYGGFAALIYSWLRNTGISRQKTMWATVSLGVLYLSFNLAIVNSWLGRPIADGLLQELLAAARCGAAMLLAYALLSRRMFDVGFAINRALAMAIISSFLLFAFAVTEFAVDKLLHFHGRETNIVIDAAVALGVILSFHRIQHWVDHHINQLFFHQWQEAAEDMRQFMASATHISDIDALQEKFIAAVARFADVDSVAIYVMEREGVFSLWHSSVTGMPVAMEANDDTIIRLRHVRARVEMDQQWIFPMLVRGEVLGLVCVGAKRNGNPLRTDELALLDSSVHQLGLDLESLRASAIKLRVTVAEHEQHLLTQRVTDLERTCRAQEREAVALRQLAGQMT